MRLSLRDESYLQGKHIIMPNRSFPVQHIDKGIRPSLINALIDEQIQIFGMLHDDRRRFPMLTSIARIAGVARDGSQSLIPEDPGIVAHVGPKVAPGVWGPLAGQNPSDSLMEPSHHETDRRAALGSLHGNLRLSMPTKIETVLMVCGSSREVKKNLNPLRNIGLRQFGYASYLFIKNIPTIGELPILMYPKVLYDCMSNDHIRQVVLDSCSSPYKPLGRIGAKAGMPRPSGANVSPRGFQSPTIRFNNYVYVDATTILVYTIPIGSISRRNRRRFQVEFNYIYSITYKTIQI
jgi:hypothetical protein